METMKTKIDQFEHSMVDDCKLKWLERMHLEIEIEFFYRQILGPLLNGAAMNGHHQLQMQQHHATHKYQMRFAIAPATYAQIKIQAWPFCKLF